MSAQPEAQEILVSVLARVVLHALVDVALDAKGLGDSEQPSKSIAALLAAAALLIRRRRDRRGK
jgi:MYXO-CTERM domain-containing protein